MPLSPRPALAGAAAALAAVALAGGVLAPLVPAGAALAPVARMADSLAPYWLAVALVLAALSAATGLRRTGGALGLAALIAGTALTVAQHRGGQPLATGVRADVTVLFLNALADDGARAEAIVTAVLAEDADIVVIAEAAAIAPALDRLRAAYAYVSPCPDDPCEMLVASRTEPLRFWRMQLSPGWPPRYGVAEIVLPSGKRTFVAASHLAKPWYTALAEPEAAQLAAQWAWFDGPVVAVGDFNAAPWGRTLRDLTAATDLRALRWPPGTWPATSGALPIDLVLTGNGARITAIRTFGAGTGSNHRGLVADIALP